MKKLILCLLMAFVLFSSVSCHKEETIQYDENDKDTWWCEDYDRSVYFPEESETDSSR